jgi:hypothetical protein
MHFNGDTVFFPLNPADSRSTILFLYIDEVKRKTPKWLRVNKGNILHKKYINILAYYYLMFTGMIKPLKHKETQLLKV